MSDLHLETPLVQPSYATFKIKLHANRLFLLGDIGLVKDEGLFFFLEKLLKSTPNLTIFYIFGNHESYQMVFEDALRKMRDFTLKMKRDYGERLILLHRDRYDVNSTITILGCPLWSHIPSDRAVEAQQRLTDFNETRGIRGWTLERHNLEHQKDLQWLNQQVQAIQSNEPQRQIIILTHHSPTRDPRGNDPNHTSSSIACGFSTDLSNDECWTSKSVKMWAFGHTHFSFSFHDEKTQKLVLANQKGYGGMDASNLSSFQVKVVEPNNTRWDLIPIVEASASKPKNSVQGQQNLDCPRTPTETTAKPPKESLIKRASQQIPALFRIRS
jgi:hypothetical protein